MCSPTTSWNSLEINLGVKAASAPLKRGGADAPWNMQWQTIAAGKAKDATE
jgi:hypothetical protein